MKKRLLSTISALGVVLLALAVGCGGSGDSSDDGGGGTTAPEIMSSTPAGGTTGTALNGSTTIEFSEEMDCATVNESSFTLTAGFAAVPVPGTVICTGKTAVFWPSTELESGTIHTARVGTGATSMAGVPLAAAYTWTFTTGSDVTATVSVPLGTAGNYVILAKSGISTVPISDITGDLGISPAAASAVTGFSLTLDATTRFSTSTQVIGRVYAANDSPPTPSLLTTAVGDMELAFTDAAGRAPDVTELGAGDIGGLTLDPGVYKWGTGLLIPTDVTLDGSATDVWIFQVAQDLIVSSAARVILTGGARPENVFWQVSGRVDLGTIAHLEGIVLTQTAVTLATGASVNGRLLAQTAVNLDGNVVTQPTP